MIFLHWRKQRKLAVEVLIRKKRASLQGAVVYSTRHANGTCKTQVHLRCDFGAISRNVCRESTPATAPGSLLPPAMSVCRASFSNVAEASNEQPCLACMATFTSVRSAFRRQRFHGCKRVMRHCISRSLDFESLSKSSRSCKRFARPFQNSKRKA